MVSKVQLDNMVINITGFQQEFIDEKRKITFDFKVKSGEEYHDITTLLYKQTFDVKVPEKNIEFRGTISNYSTSITNLYEEGNVGDFKLELVEVK